MQIVNNRIGNFASGLTHQQANGIGIHASFAGRIQIQSNDLTGPGTAKSGIANPSAVQPLMSGNFPLQAGYNPELGRTVALATAATVAAATTTYLGVNAEQGTEAATFIMVAQKGAVTQLQFQVVAAPGAGKTFTYTLRKNGQDTALAGEISGDAAYVVTAYGAVAVDPGDYLSVKLVTASGAAATLHRGYLSISG